MHPYGCQFCYSLKIKHNDVMYFNRHFRKIRYYLQLSNEISSNFPNHRFLTYFNTIKDLPQGQAFKKLYMPNIAIVFCDGTITGEETSVADIHQHFFCPDLSI